MRLFRHDGLVLGRTGPLPIFPTVTVPQHARSGHLYTIGKTGKGKSKFLQYCLYQDIVAGRGCGVIDPHADLVADLLGLLYRQGVFVDRKQLDRIIYINPADTSYSIPFNILAVAGEPYEVAQNVIEAFRRTWPETLAAAPHFSNVMLHALLVLIRTKQTLIDLPRLLVDFDFREHLLAQACDPDVTAFFHDRYDRWGRDAVVMRESTLNKVTALTLNPYLKRMLGQKENRLNFRQIMDEGKVLLVDLGHCDDESQRLIGSLITIGIEQAAFSRHNIPPASRRPFYLYIDEFQDFTANSGSVKTLSKVLSGARKFGLHLTLAHQNLSQLAERMQGAIMGNIWTKVLFGIARSDAEWFVREVGDVDVSLIKHDAQTDTQHPVYAPLSEQWHLWAARLTRQAPRRAVVHDYTGKATFVWTMRVPGSDLPEQVARNIRQYSLARYGRARAVVDQELERLYQPVEATRVAAFDMQ